MQIKYHVLMFVWIWMSTPTISYLFIWDFGSYLRDLMNQTVAADFSAAHPWFESGYCASTVTFEYIKNNFRVQYITLR